MPVLNLHLVGLRGARGGLLACVVHASVLSSSDSLTSSGDVQVKRAAPYGKPLFGSYQSVNQYSFGGDRVVVGRTFLLPHVPDRLDPGRNRARRSAFCALA